MANPPFPFVSVSHYKPFRAEVCDNWDTLWGKDAGLRRASLAAAGPAEASCNLLKFIKDLSVLGIEPLDPIPSAHIA